MAQRVQIILEDDYDGTEADQTVTFGLDGAEYEIDLSAKNASALRDSLAPWVTKARRTGGRRRRAGATSNGSSGSGGGVSTNEVRAWAQDQGMKVSARGRVAAEVMEAYRKAH